MHARYQNISGILICSSRVNSLLGMWSFFGIRECCVHVIVLTDYFPTIAHLQIGRIFLYNVSYYYCNGVAVVLKVILCQGFFWNT